MSDRDLRLQVVLKAVDKITRPFRNARDGSRELSAALKASKDSLKNLNDQAGRIDGFRKTRQQLAITEKNLASARHEAAALATQFAATNRPTAQQSRLLEQAKNRVNDLQQSYNGLLRSVQQQRGALTAAGIDTKQLSAAQRRLKTDASAASDAIERQQRELKKLGERQAKLRAVRERYGKTLEARDKVAGAGAASTAAGVAMSMPFAAAVRASADMEDAMKGVAKQVNGLRDDKGNRTAQFYDMQAAIKAASEQLPMQNGAVDYAALVEGGARMGVTNQNDSYADQKRDLLAFATTAAKASTAFELPADQLAEGLGKIGQLYKIPTRNIEQLGDALNYLDDNAMSKGADIIDVLQRMGGNADRLNFRQAAALGSTFLSLGATSEIAASSANAMVRELSIATMQSNRFMDGMDLLKLNPAKIEKQMTTDAMGTIIRVLEKVKKLPSSKRLSALTMIFGKEFGKDAAKLANNLPELRRQLALTQGDAAKGSMEKESAINKDSLSAQWMLSKTGLNNAMSGLGDTLRQPLMDIMGAIKKVTGAAAQWVNKNQETAGTLMKVGAAVSFIVIGMGTLAISLAAIVGPMAVVKFALMQLGYRGPGVFGLIGKAIVVLGKSVLWLGRLMFANPILAALGLIAMAVIAIWRNWDTIGPMFKATWQAVTDNTSAAWEAIKDKISGAWTWVKSLFADGTLQGVISKGWDAIRDGIAGAWQSIKVAVSQKWDELVNSASTLPERFKEAGSNMISALLDGITSKWEALKARLSSMTDLLPGFMKPSADKGGATPVNPLSPASPTGFAGLFDNGGYIPAGQYGIAGENGPELVNGPARITSRRRTAALAASAALALGMAAAPADARSLHPMSLPAQAYQSKAQRAQAAQPVAAPQINASFTIVQQPGESQDDLVDKVMRRLKAEQRKAEARARSSYRDRGGYDE
ncbi:phage tail tape measure protein [Pantoea allii]|uniref:phage tail tape measure protein n=1 Tax=Pantoea allii TaxID=574096 RepID=UPI0024B7E33C|nr:phage tail tape measure protein [Pantoea allii]MDJ0037341.1 phage tail tape measure protein [Pantoea allii]